jgi:hypothetical protein
MLIVSAAAAAAAAADRYRLPPDAVFDADHGKELLRKAILAYHPDKQGSSGVAFSWQVLAEEITKQLTRKYECFK